MGSSLIKRISSAVLSGIALLTLASPAIGETQYEKSQESGFRKFAEKYALNPDLRDYGDLYLVLSQDKELILFDNVVQLDLEKMIDDNKEALIAAVPAAIVLYSLDWANRGFGFREGEKRYIREFKGVNVKTGFIPELSFDSITGKEEYYLGVEAYAEFEKNNKKWYVGLRGVAIPGKDSEDYVEPTRGFVIVRRDEKRDISFVLTEEPGLEIEIKNRNKEQENDVPEVKIPGVMPARARGPGILKSLRLIITQGGLVVKFIAEF